ncbi:MAG: N5-glutamine methyltransferase family protein, partial [Bacteroidota bacterium]
DSRPGWDVHAMDISEAALKVAQSNAKKMKVRVEFHLLDMTSPSLIDVFNTASFDCIVSNPPYIPVSDKRNLDSRVKDFEPDLALFAPDDDPLRYYRHISFFALHALKPNGFLFLEVHENYAEATAELLEADLWSGVIVREDIFGKPRMIRATR